MVLKTALTAALFLAASAAAFAAPLTPAASTPAARETLATKTGGSDRRYAVRDCRPYNGPYGYYGNPYCEGGFSRYGKAGGWEIDLTPWFDDRTYYRDRRYRRHR
jgi:hypothetical protein